MFALVWITEERVLKLYGLQQRKTKHLAIQWPMEFDRVLPYVGVLEESLKTTKGLLSHHSLVHPSKDR